MQRKPGLPLLGKGQMAPRAGLKCTLLVIAGLASHDDTASEGRLQRDNREVLDQMRDGDRDAAQLRVGERDRELREGNG